MSAWDAAITKSGHPALIVTSPLQDQVGNWSMAEGGHHKEALLSGRVVAGPGVGSAAAPTATQVGPAGGATRRVSLLTAAAAINVIAAAGSPGNSCDGDCTPLTLVRPTLGTSRVATTAGPMDAPTWSFQVRGSKVRVTQVAIDPSALTSPPAIAGGAAAVGTQTESAVLAGRTTVTVSFSGAPTSDPPCGQTYTATAVEAAQVVAILIAGTTPGGPAPADTVCPASAAIRTVDVTLTAPLGSRLLIDGGGGGVITLNK